MTNMYLDPEFAVPVLDLGREELAPIAERYASGTPVQAPELVASKVLLVGRDGESIDPLARTLLTDGWEVWTCEGPESTTCPLGSGKTCAAREEADVTVVFMDGTAPIALSLPRMACAAKGDNPSVVALEGRIDPPRANGMHAVVGALRGTAEILRTVEDLT